MEKFFSLIQSFKQSLNNFEQDSPLFDLSQLEYYQKDSVHMGLNIKLLELKHDSGRFLTLYTRSSGEKCFYVYFITDFHPEFSMDMNIDVNMNMDINGGFICCYDISALVLSKSLALTNISSGGFGNALNVMVSTFLRKKFTKELAWCFSRNPCPFKTTTLYSHRFIVAESTITKLLEGKKSHPFSNFLIVLFLN